MKIFFVFIPVFLLFSISSNCFGEEITSFDGSPWGTMRNEINKEMKRIGRGSIFKEKPDKLYEVLSDKKAFFGVSAKKILYRFYNEKLREVQLDFYDGDDYQSKIDPIKTFEFLKNYFSKDMGKPGVLYYDKAQQFAGWDGNSTIVTITLNMSLGVISISDKSIIDEMGRAYRPGMVAGALQQISKGKKHYLADSKREPLPNGPPWYQAMYQVYFKK